MDPGLFLAGMERDDWVSNLDHVWGDRLAR